MSNAASISYLGHSTVLVESVNGKRIIIDPWLDGNPSCPQAFHDPGPIDLMALTHGHSDHTGSAVALAKKYSPTVFATYELAMLVAKDGVSQENLQPMNKGGTVEVPGGDGLAISLTHALHSSSYDSSDGNTYYAGEACGVVVKLENGKSIYHLGDTSLFSDLKIIGETFQPEVVFVPIGDRFTMGPKDAASAVSLLKPKIAIPIHYGTFDLLSGTPDEFKSAMQSNDCETVVLTPGESLKLN